MRDPNEDDTGDCAERDARRYDGHRIDADTANGDVQCDADRQQCADGRRCAAGRQVERVIQRKRHEQDADAVQM